VGRLYPKDKGVAILARKIASALNVQRSKREIVWLQQWTTCGAILPEGRRAEVPAALAMSALAYLRGEVRATAGSSETGLVADCCNYASQSNYPLSTFEKGLLAYLIAFQEFRTPWARANFQKLELSLSQHLFNFSAKVPGCMERTLKELQKGGKVDASVSADQIREALKNEKIKLVAKPHAGIDVMVSVSQTAGSFYTQMLWFVFHTSAGRRCS
jgi:hypothetical protein